METLLKSIPFLLDNYYDNIRGRSVNHSRDTVAFGFCDNLLPGQTFLSGKRKMIS